MAAIHHAHGRPSTVLIPRRGTLCPSANLDLNSTTTSDESPSDIVHLVAHITREEDLGSDRIDEQRPWAVDIGYSSVLDSRALSAHSAISSVSSPRARMSVRGIAAGLKKKVGRHLRRLSNDFRGGKGALAVRRGQLAGASQLPNTRYELPPVSPAVAENGEEVLFVTQSDNFSRNSMVSDEDLAPPAKREIRDPARLAGATVLDDGRVNYQLFAPAGEGGFASVFYAHAHPYLADNESLYPKVVAIKVFNRGRLASMGISIRHVNDECKALQQATRSLSPFLTHLISTFHDAQHIYAVMHAYAGTLADRLCDTNRRMPSHEIKQLAAELVVGVQAVNEMGYIHRDLKAENVFLSPAGHLVVGDFTTVINPALRQRPGSESWLAARVRAESRPVGTPLRYAPEQLDSKFYTSKVDLWAIGLVMLELFRGNCTDAIFRPSDYDEHPGSVDILTRDLRPEVNTFVDDEHARRLVRRLLSRDPGTRLSIRQILSDPYFTSGREQDVEEYWRRVKSGDHPALYYPPKIVAPKANKVQLFFKTPEREPAKPLEPGFDPAHRAYHYECDESLLVLDDKIYGRLAVVEV